jgi:hypothetical protein
LIPIVSGKDYPPSVVVGVASFLFVCLPFGLCTYIKIKSKKQQQMYMG